MQKAGEWARKELIPSETMSRPESAILELSRGEGMMIAMSSSRKPTMERLLRGSRAPLLLVRRPPPPSAPLALSTRAMFPAGAWGRRHPPRPYHQYGA